MFGILADWRFLKWQGRQHETRIQLLERRIPVTPQQGGGGGGGPLQAKGGAEHLTVYGVGGGGGGSFPGSFPGAVHSGAAMAAEVSYPAERPHAWPAYVNLYRNVDGSLSIGQQVYVSPERAMGKISEAYAGNYIGCAPLDVEALALAAAKGQEK